MAVPVIVIDPEVMNGAPCFRGTRVPFNNLIDYLEGDLQAAGFKVLLTVDEGMPQPNQTIAIQT